MPLLLIKYDAREKRFMLINHDTYYYLILLPRCLLDDTDTATAAVTDIHFCARVSRLSVGAGGMYLTTLFCRCCLVFSLTIAGTISVTCSASS